MKLKIIVSEGTVLSKWCGIAWPCWDKMAWVAYPIPLNLVMRFLHCVWIMLQNGCRPSWLDYFIREVRKREYDRGRADGWAAGWADAVTENYQKGFLRLGNQIGNEFETLRRALMGKAGARKADEPLPPEHPG